MPMPARSPGRAWSRCAVAVALVALANATGDVCTSYDAVGFPTDFGFLASHAMHNGARARTHLSTDRVTYQPGEIVFFQVFSLDPFTRKPVSPSRPSQAFAATARHSLLRPILTVTDPLKETVISGVLEPHATTYDATNNPAGVASYAWTIPSDVEGGDYAVSVDWGVPGFAPSAPRTLRVEAYTLPSMEIVIDFEKDAYAAGETVRAAVAVRSLVGGSLQLLQLQPEVSLGGGATVSASWDGRIDIVDATAHATITFTLPTPLGSDVGSLNIVATRAGTVESKARTLPLVLQSLAISVLPEGGELVEGVENRFYVESVFGWGGAASFAAAICEVDASARGATPHGTAPCTAKVGRVATAHEGRGSALVTPRAGHAYFLRVLEPAGITQDVWIPEAKASGGVALLALSNVFDAGAPIRVRLASPTAISSGLSVALFALERPLAIVPVSLEAGVPLDVSLSPQNGAVAVDGGVLRVTVLQQQQGGGSSWLPIAERLVFQRAARSLNVVASVNVPDAGNFAPGDTVLLTVKATDETGAPAAGALVAAAVVDDALHTLVSPRDRPPLLPSMVFLESDVASLKNAHEFLEHEDALAGARHVDLLLGVQGWRRFVYADVAGSLGQAKAASKSELRALQRLLALSGGDPRFVRVVGGDACSSADRCASFLGSAAATLGERPSGCTVEYLAQPAELLYGLEDGPVAEEVALAAPDAAGGGGQVRNKNFDDAGDAAAEPGFCPDCMAQPPPFFPYLSAYAREYKHARRYDFVPGSRVDFTPTVFWSRAMVTNAQGVATVTFALADALSTYRVTANAVHPASGRLGATRSTTFLAQTEFSVDMFPPTHVVAGDAMLLPIVLNNRLPSAMDVSLRFVESRSCRRTLASTPEADAADAATDALIAPSAKGLAISTRTGALSIAGMTSTRAYMRVQISELAAPGRCFARLEARAFPPNARQDVPAHESSVQRAFGVATRGFPSLHTAGGVLSPPTRPSGNTSFRVEPLALPKTLQASVLLYPSPLASLTQALEELIRAPHGCFEQTSSTTYPMVMAMRYMSTHGIAGGPLFEKASGFLDAGYKKLATFECASGGFEWFGEGDGHEALTAYGVLQFMEMADVRDVDPVMLARTSSWLMQRRDGAGRFLRNSRALDSFGSAPPHVTDAYIVYSLLRSGRVSPSELQTEIAYLRDVQLPAYGGEPYFVGLVAAVLFETGDAGNAQLAETLASRLAGWQRVQDGAVVNDAAAAGTTITKSAGKAFVVESTAVAVIAWLLSANHASTFAVHSTRAIEFLSASVENGRFASTQATVLTLKAIIEFDLAKAAGELSGTVQLAVNGVVRQTVDFDTLPPLGAARSSRTEPASEHFTSVVVPAKDVVRTIPFLGVDFPALLVPGSTPLLELTMAPTRAAGAGDDDPQLAWSVAVEYETSVPSTHPQAPFEFETSLSAASVVEASLVQMDVRVRNTAASSFGMVVARIAVPGGLSPRVQRLRELVAAGTVAQFELQIDSHAKREIVLYWRGIGAALGAQVAGGNDTLRVQLEMEARVPGAAWVAPASVAYPYYADELKTWVLGTSVEVTRRPLASQDSPAPILDTRVEWVLVPILSDATAASAQDGWRGWVFNPADFTKPPAHTIEGGVGSIRPLPWHVVATIGGAGALLR